MNDKSHNKKIEKASEVTLCDICNEPPMKSDPQDQCGYCGLKGHESCIEDHEADCDQNPDNMDEDEFKHYYGKGIDEGDHEA